MSTQTPNYGLTKPTYPEPADVAVINGNMDIIDTQMKTNADGIGSVSADVTTLETKVDTLETKVEKINAKDKVQDLDIAMLKAAAEGKLFTTVTDSTVAHVKDVPSGTLLSRLDKLGGRTIVGNQLIQNGNFADSTGWNIGAGYSISNNEFTGTGTVRYSGMVSKPDYAIPIIGTHKYFFSIQLKSNYVQQGTCGPRFYKSDDSYTTVNVLNQLTGNGNWETLSAICDLGSNDYIKARIYAFQDSASSDWTQVSGRNCKLVDLTQMFGAGNEPSTVAEVEAIIGTDYIDYNTGSLESAEVSKIVSVGFNIWDEQWESGNYNTNTGEKGDNVNFIRGKNFIKVQGGQTYYVKCSDKIYINFYDVNQSFIAYIGGSYGNATFTVPSNCEYITIWFRTQYGTTYLYDTCINLSNASLNGTYKPYFHSEAPIPQSIQSLQGYGKSAGNAKFEFDTITKKSTDPVGEYTITGNENWQQRSSGVVDGQTRYKYSCANALPSSPKELPKWVSNEGDRDRLTSASWSVSATDFGVYFYNGSSNTIYYISTIDNVDDLKTWLSSHNVNVYYELATPIETDLSDILTDDFLIEVESNGTIEFVGNEDYNIPVPSTEQFFVKVADAI